MKFEYRYYGASHVDHSAGATGMHFAPDTLRAPTHFVADLKRHLPFREAISALHHVVLADQRYQAPDKSAYRAWLQQQEGTLLANYMARAGVLRERIAPLEAELKALRASKQALMKPFQRAQSDYFDYLYEANRDAWIVLDPVITVHPDRVFFECFSRDESSYASFSCSRNVFEQVGEVACGTTNIDYSAGLYGEFQKIRDYKTTRLAIDPDGFEVRTADDPGFIEQKIDVPDSWVRGFLQVSSAMTLPMHRLELHPMDVHNFCLQLRRHKERVGPRSIRFVLTPGAPVRAIFEPWNTELVCRRSIYQGSQTAEVRIWGRRRLLLLERLIPVAHSFSVHLAGSGLPSFWIANLPDMQFTLGLSGWTANDWSRAGQFDLLAPRANVDADSLARVFDALGRRWFASSGDLALDTGLDTSVVASALTLYTQAGRVIYDVANGVYRLRELSRVALPLDSLRFASPQEEKAAQLLLKGRARSLSSVAQSDGGRLLGARVDDHGKQYAATLRLDADLRITGGSCECSHFVRHRLRMGPCEHMLALRLAESRRADAGVPDASVPDATLPDSVAA